MTAPRDRAWLGLLAAGAALSLLYLSVDSLAAKTVLVLAVTGGGAAAVTGAVWLRRPLPAA